MHDYNLSWNGPGGWCKVQCSVYLFLHDILIQQCVVYVTILYVATEVTTYAWSKQPFINERNNVIKQHALI